MQLQFEVYRNYSKDVMAREFLYEDKNQKINQTEWEYLVKHNRNEVHKVKGKKRMLLYEDIA
jgi:hypothetical protein